MAEPQTEPVTEREQVEDWREHELLRAGYAADDAIALSRSPVDLHTACDLVAAGCDPLVAMRILF